MEDENNSDFTLYILLIVSGILMMVDGLELIHTILNWHYGFMIVEPVFQKCIKYELISKTIFTHFSFFAALSAFSLTLFLIVCQDFFVKKLINTYMNLNYIIFGPLLLTFTSLGFFLWEDVTNICNKNNLNVKEFSLSNAISLIGCFFISVFITTIVEFSVSINFLMNSLMKREGGSNFIGKLFWSTVHRRHNNRNNNRNRENSNSSNDNIRNNNNNARSNINNNNEVHNSNSNNNNNANENNRNLNANENENEAEVILPIRQNLEYQNEVILENNNNNNDLNIDRKTNIYKKDISYSIPKFSDDYDFKSNNNKDINFNTNININKKEIYEEIKLKEEENLNDNAFYNNDNNFNRNYNHPDYLKNNKLLNQKSNSN